MPPASHSLNATSPKLTFNPPAGFSITLVYLSTICKLLLTEMEIIEFLPILAGSPVYFVISRIWTNAHFLVCLLSCHCLSIFNSLFSYLLSLILYFQLSVFSTFCIFNFLYFQLLYFQLSYFQLATCPILHSHQQWNEFSSLPRSLSCSFYFEFVKVKIVKVKVWQVKVNVRKWMCESECVKVNVWKWVCESLKVWVKVWKWMFESFPVSHDPFPVNFISNLWMWKLWKWKYEKWKCESVKVWKCESEGVKVWMCESESVKVW